MDWKQWITQPVRGRGTFFTHSAFLSNLMKIKLDFSIPRDRIGSRLSPVKPFKTLILSRGEAMTLDASINSSGIRIFTVGSYNERGSGAGFVIYLPDPPFIISDSITLSFQATVFQAEVQAIKQAADFLINNSTYISHDIFFFSDSIAAIQALDSSTVKALTVADCLASLTKLAVFRKEIRISWVPGHSGVWGNEIADALAVAASNSSSPPKVTLPLAPSVIHGIICKFFRSSHEKAWKDSKTCTLTRPILTNLLISKVNCLVTSRRLTRWVTYILSNHAPVSAFLHKIGKQQSPVCQFCVQEPETIQHYVCYCPYFSLYRLEFLGHFFITQSSWLTELSLGNLLGFLRSTRRFDRGKFMGRPPD